jgi:hypothetical protein
MSVKMARTTLLKRLENRRAAVLDRWVGLVFDTYPPDTAMILKAGGDRFGNPVNYCVSCNLGSILDALISGSEPETLFSNLEEIIKVRAVQDFTPTAAVSFMALLKQALASELDRNYDSDPAMKELDQKIDLLSNACSVIYADCRQRIARIRDNEQKKMALNVARMMRTAESGK